MNLYSYVYNFEPDWTPSITLLEIDENLKLLFPDVYFDGSSIALYPDKVEVTVYTLKKITSEVATKIGIYLESIKGKSQVTPEPEIETEHYEAVITEAVILNKVSEQEKAAITAELISKLPEAEVES